jgi:RNase H-fold protein (predicted Holliday junction resolvase)
MFEYLVSSVIGLLYWWVVGFREFNSRTARGSRVQILGVTVGEENVGISYSDFVAEFAPGFRGAAPTVIYPIGFLQWQDGLTIAKELLEIAKEEGASTIVLGIPQDGSWDGGRTEKLKDLNRALTAILPEGTILTYWCEDLSGLGKFDKLFLAERYGTLNAGPDATEMITSFVELWRPKLGQGW